MPIVINFNICDNSPECSGKAVCPTEAIYWDANKLNALGNAGTLCVDNAKCISCGKCISEEGCPVGAIILAETAQELTHLEKSVVAEDLSIQALFVDRFGAEPIDESICITPDKIQNILCEDFTIVENFSDETIQCLLTSIPILSIVNYVKDLTGNDVRYYKCNCTEVANINYELPCLKIFKNKILLTQINGYFDNSRFKDLVTILQKALSKKS